MSDDLYMAMIEAKAYSRGDTSRVDMESVALLVARIAELEAANAAVEEENDLLRDVIQQKHARVEVLTAALTEITDYVSRHHRNLPEDVEPLLDNARAALAAGTTESEGT